MEFDNDCPMDEDYQIAKDHGMSHEDFVKYNRGFYCPICPNWDCYAKGKHNSRS